MRDVALAVHHAHEKGIVHRDLKPLKLKCLEKDKSRRYASARDLGDEPQRFVDDDPIVAHPPSRWYVLRKRIAKRPLQWGFAAAMVTAVVSGVWFGTSQLLRASREARRAQHEAEEKTRAEEEKRRGAEASERRARLDEWRARLETSRNLYEQSFAPEPAGRLQAAAACCLRPRA